MNYTSSPRRDRPSPPHARVYQATRTAATAITAAVAVAAVVQGFLATRHTVASSTLLTADYGTQLAALLAVLLVASARADDSTLGLSLSVFAASMFLPVMHEHAASMPLAGVAYLLNCALVTVLAAAGVRRMRPSRRHGGRRAPTWA